MARLLSNFLMIFSGGLAKHIMLDNSESILGPFEKSHYYWCHPYL